MSGIKRTQLIHYLSAALLAVILICQFTPYWVFPSEGGDVSASVSSYIWLPSDHTALETTLKEHIGQDFSVDQLVLPSVLVLVLSAAGIALCLFRNGQSWTGLLPLGCGIIGTWAMLTQPAFKLGSFWGLHMILYVLAMVLGACSLYFALRKEKKD